MRIRLKKKIFAILSAAIFLCQGTWAAGVDKDSSGAATTQRKSIVGLKKNFSLNGKSSSSTILPSPVTYGLIQNFLSGLSVGGYYRGFFYSRRMTHGYGNLGKNKVMNIGDGYFDPGLMMYIGGNPTPTTSFGTEILLLNPFDTWQGPGYTHQKVIPYFSMVLRGGINTKVGNFNIIAGGIEWLRLTPFTFGSNVGFNRYSIFERRPWDPVGNIKTRYASYYYNGTINQDTRWGTQAFKGFTVNGFLTKLNTNIDVFYGRTQYTGGITREKIVRPGNNLGVRIKKNINSDNYISLNTFNSFSKSDSIHSRNDIQWNIFTSEFQFKKAGVMLAGEVGVGRYMSPDYPEKWGMGILADLMIPKKYTFIPIALRYFQIAQSFTSNVANFNNVTIREVSTGYNGLNNPLYTPFGGNMENVGDLNNNRRGVALNTDIKAGRFVFTFGTQVSGEMDKLAMDTVINYSHRVNNLVWSRLPGVYPMAGMFGPNGRVGTYYRGAYERVIVHDRNADNTPKYNKHYNAMDFQMKYKTKLLNKDIYINYLGTFSSVGTQIRPISSFQTNRNTYITAQYHEMDIYYQILPDLILDFYAGIERIKGNDLTDLGPTGKARNQTGEALGIGFDFAISNQTTLFFRQRWFSYEDRSFPGEKFNGNEATLELKIFF